MSENISGSHSAEVKMWLDCGQYGYLSLMRVTPKAVIIENPVDTPPCDADLIVSVDGDLVVTRVRITGGISARRRAARVKAIDDHRAFPNLC